MADLSVTASEVLPSSTALVTAGTSGDTITAGHAVYLDSSTSTYKKCASSSATLAACAGIALNTASAGQPVDILTDGLLTIGASAAPAIGEPYYISATAGGLQPDVDVASGEFVTYIGSATTAAIIKVKINATGVAHA